MQSGLVYILQSLVNLYLIAFALRLAMQWVRADFRNPIVKFVLTVTNPLVLPLRKVIPGYGGLDMASLLLALLLQLLGIAAIVMGLGIAMLAVWQMEGQTVAATSLGERHH